MVLWYKRWLMPKKGNPPLQGELLQGTLDLLILRTLMSGPAHGHTIAHVIEHQSEDVTSDRARLALSRAPSSRGPRVDRVVLGNV